MTTIAIDPTAAARAIQLANSGASLNRICDETGLLLNEVRVVLGRERQQRQQTAAAPPGLPKAQPKPPTVTTIGRPCPDPAAHAAKPDHIAALIDAAARSDMAKVRAAAKRVTQAIDRLREVMDATEAERRQREEARRKAEKEAAERAERERVARATIEALERQLAQAKAMLAEVRPTRKRHKRYVSPEELEVLRARAKMMTERKRAKREAEKAQQT